MDRLDHDFYQVGIDADGNKIIHVDGYCYYSGGDSDRPYRHVTFCWLYLPIGFTQEQYDIISCECKQYINDLTEKDMHAVVENYKATPMRMADVTQDTPCGWYMDC